MTLHFTQRNKLYILGVVFTAIFFALSLFTVAHAAICSSVPAGGDYIVSADCGFTATVDGVDGGGITIALDTMA